MGLLDEKTKRINIRAHKSRHNKTMTNSKLKCSCWHEAHCGFSCLIGGCECRECDCKECVGPIPEPIDNPNQYKVYPDDDGFDTPKNPFSQV